MGYEALLQFAQQHAEAVTYGVYTFAVLLSTNRARTKVPVIPNLYVTGLLGLAASGFYIFMNPTPSTGLEAVTFSIANAVLIGFIAYLFGKWFDLPI